MRALFIYITNPSKKQARRVARHLLKRKLIACANIFGPVNSLYHWGGKLVDENEYILLAKTAAADFGKIKKEVEKIHPYSIPCIAKIPVSFNRKYFAWLKNQIV